MVDRVRVVLQHRNIIAVHLVVLALWCCCGSDVPNVDVRIAVSVLLGTCHDDVGIVRRGLHAQIRRLGGALKRPHWSCEAGSCVPARHGAIGDTGDKAARARRKRLGLGDACILKRTLRFGDHAGYLVDQRERAVVSNGKQRGHAVGCAERDEMRDIGGRGVGCRVWWNGLYVERFLGAVEARGGCESGARAAPESVRSMSWSMVAEVGM